MFDGVMEREIRYCTTEDGVSIAYCEAGEGTPVIQAASLNHIEIECGFGGTRSSRRAGGPSGSMAEAPDRRSGMCAACRLMRRPRWAEIDEIRFA